MKWKEFRSLLIGIDPNTPLGRVVQIRAETDPEVIRAFTPGQKKIHDDWERRSARECDPGDLEKFLGQMLSFFSSTGDVIEAEKN